MSQCPPGTVLDRPLGHCEPGAVSQPVQTLDGPLLGPSLTLCWAPGMAGPEVLGFSCSFLKCYLFLILFLGAGPSAPAEMVLEIHPGHPPGSTTLVSLVAGQKLTIHLRLVEGFLMSSNSLAEIVPPSSVTASPCFQSTAAKKSRISLARRFIQMKI